MRGAVAILEHLRAFGEERPLLRKERLELAEVHHRRIDFDLPEIGIDRAGQREVRRQAVLEIETAVHLAVMRARERIASIDARGQVGARHAVRHHLERALGLDPFDAREVGEARDHPVLAFRRVHQAIDLAVLRDLAEEVDAPRLRRLIGKAQLRIRDANLGHPAARNDLRGEEPDRVPTPIVVDVVEQVHVDLHVRRIDPEAGAAEAIVLRVNVEADETHD